MYTLKNVFRSDCLYVVRHNILYLKHWLSVRATGVDILSFTVTSLWSVESVFPPRSVVLTLLTNEVLFVVVLLLSLWYLKST